jgi:hypothetical protein
MTSLHDNKDEKQKKQQKEQQDFKGFYLLVSFDLGSDVITIVENKILPQVEQFVKDSLVV